MVKVRQAIVVEGRYDKNTLSQIVDTAIFQTNGFGIMKDAEQLLYNEWQYVLHVDRAGLMAYIFERIESNH